MILIDRMVRADADGNLCELVTDRDSVFLQDEGVPAFAGIEYMAQAVAAHAGWKARIDGEPVKVGFLLGTPKLEIHRPFFPLGHRIQVSIERDWGDDELMRFACKISDADTGEVYQEAGLNVFQPKDLEAYLARKRKGVSS